MNDTTGATRRTLAYRARLVVSKLVLTWEQLWPPVWPAAALAAIYAATALFGFFTNMAAWLHAIVLSIGAIGGAFLLLRGWRQVRWPGRDRARRRLEVASAVVHRPLAAVEDRLATGDGSDPLMTALWNEHRRRMAAAARDIRLSLPNAGWGRRVDPFGARAIVAVVLVGGFLFAGSDAERRLLDGLRPNFARAQAASTTFDAWITPPSYTGMAPVFLRAEASGGELSVPTGSILVARIHGGRRAPELHVDSERKPFQPIGRQDYEIEHKIVDGRALSLHHGSATIGRWTLSVIPDVAPTIEFAEPPSTSAREALRISYDARDDYGLAKVEAIVKRQDTDETMTIELPLARSTNGSSAETSYHDLTPHPWAGLPVILQLSATDEIGQNGVSEEAEVTLPERRFTHPIAKAIVEQRKVLALAPHHREPVARALARIASEPQRFYDDTTAFLALRVAISRLMRGEKTKAVADEVVDLLWSTALRIEDGNLSLAEAELRAAQDRLLDALSRNADDEEIEQRMAEVREALEKFLRALAERALQNRQLGELMPQNLPPNSLIDSEQLKNLLDRALDLSRTGSKDAARELLAQLRELLENLREGLMSGEMMSGMPGEELLQDLNDLMRMQQELLDEAFREGQQQRGQGQQGQGDPNQRGRPQQGQGQGPGQGMSDRQENLRRMLGEIMRRLGEGGSDIPGAFGKAERNMNDARSELEARRPGSAVGPMTDALDALRQGANAVIREMLEAMGVDPGLDGTGANPFTRVGRDPLGRPQSGFGIFDDERIAIPDESDVQRARDILRELHRRAGDRNRPKVELDYIERLLRRF
ncbi:MAG: TIGR02302 family protein [Alphaproteobacteria bacterium]|nr:TIGR02302 family protein [Alphaproteobacteria bacterium]